PIVVAPALHPAPYPPLPHGHRDPPSFPTRRSSDLADGGRGGGRSRRRASPPRFAAAVRSLRGRCRASLSRVLGPRGCRVTAVGRPRWRPGGCWRDRGATSVSPPTPPERSSPATRGARGSRDRNRREVGA